MIVSIASILGTVVTVYSVFRLRNAVKTSFTLDMRRLINRIERNKEPFNQTVPAAYRELFDVQDELETISKKFLAMFNIK
jgi:hypothetical protein